MHDLGHCSSKRANLDGILVDEEQELRATLPSLYQAFKKNLSCGADSSVGVLIILLAGRAKAPVRKTPSWAPPLMGDSSLQRE